MKKILLLLSWIWTAFFLVNFTLTMLLLYPLFWYFLRNEKGFPTVMKLKRFWARLIIFDTGIFYTCKVSKDINPKQAYVFCPNHTSYLDVILSYIVIPNYFHFMGKYELAKVPLFGIFFRNMDIAVNRASRIDSHKAFVRAGSDIDKNISIVMFPEGTISAQTPKMSRFKSGPFKLAISKQVPIVPVTFKNNWKILRDERYGYFGGRPGIADIIIHAPIPTKGLTDDDVEKLQEQVYKVIDSELDYPRTHEHRQAVS